MACPEATAEPEPLLEPPVMWSRFQGFRAGAKGVVKSGPPRANSCIASLPKRIPPARHLRQADYMNNMFVRYQLAMAEEGAGNTDEGGRARC